ncbi:MAG: ChaN family lipoprotein [Bacteroidales bacterium]|nr:ChaN family lipoprotein [Bacteroidales bacterium]MDT8431372.1 ChaN family lipoprotein [Bacteroidales bacterium]
MRKTLLKTSLTLLMLLSFSLTHAQKEAYKLYNSKGKEVRYERMLDDCKRADVVLFGELHNDPIAHWMQFELMKDLHGLIGEKLVLGAEMFEADGQMIMDEYFTGIITEKKFEEEMRLWNNYKTDYKPLVEFAKDSGLRFVATNIPRRYANTVFNLGLDTLNNLTDLAKAFMMPLPVLYDTTLASYLALAGGGPMGGHGSPNLRDAQAVKDATMAFFILENLRSGETFLHFNGAYHSDNYEGIGYFLRKLEPELKIVTISTVNQADISSLEEENEGKADYILAVPESMTRTY